MEMDGGKSIYRGKEKQEKMEADGWDDVGSIRGTGALQPPKKDGDNPQVSASVPFDLPVSIFAVLAPN